MNGRIKCLNGFLLSFQFVFLYECIRKADQSKGFPHEEYDDSDEDYDNDDDEDEHIQTRKQFPFFTPVTPYPPVYCTYVLCNSTCNCG